MTTTTLFGMLSFFWSEAVKLLMVLQAEVEARMTSQCWLLVWLGQPPKQHADLSPERKLHKLLLPKPPPSTELVLAGVGEAVIFHEERIPFVHTSTYGRWNRIPFSCCRFIFVAPPTLVFTGMDGHAPRPRLVCSFYQVEARMTGQWWFLVWLGQPPKQHADLSPA
jgi:hypothetical protein